MKTIETLATISSHDLTSACGGNSAAIKYGGKDGLAYGSVPRSGPPAPQQGSCASYGGPNGCAFVR